MADTNQLQVPSAARNDRRSFELLRVWVADAEQHISLRAGIWDDPAAWGTMLADLAGHIANTFEQSAPPGRKPDRRELLARMKEALDAEWNSPSDDLSGELTS